MPGPLLSLTPGIATVKIRQIYSRNGKVYCCVTMPTRVMTAYGWKPGDFLVAYPTKGRALKFVHQEDVAPPDYDRSFKPGPDDLKPPKPGSWAEVEEKSIRRTEALLEDIEAMAQSHKRTPVTDEEEEREERDRDARKGIRRVSPERSQKLRLRRRSRRR